MPDEPLQTFENGEQAFLLAKAIVDTVREPLLVLDEDLRIVVASRSFYRTFEMTRPATQGHKIYDLDDGLWDIPELRLLLEKIVPEHEAMEGFEVERDFPRIGRRTMLLNARKVFYEGKGQTTILLAFEDTTERRKIERAVQMLLTELSHRVANSLQIIASILLMKARSVESAETRLHLQDAHRRVMSVASVQKHLQASGNGELIPVGPYLSKLCETLASSMIGDNRPISIKVVADDGATTSDQAVSIGLIVTELVINALKHAFAESTIDGHVVVGYEVHGANWKLSISDTGAGMPDLRPGAKKTGLGTSLINALAQQLDAQVEIVSGGSNGTTVSLTHAVFVSRLPTAA